MPLISLKSYKQEDSVTTAGVVASVKKIITRNNQSMLFVKIEDGLGSVELLIFPKLLEETAEVWQDGTPVIINGRLSDKDDDVKLLINKVGVLDYDDPNKSIDEFKRVILEFKSDPKNKYRNMRRPVKETGDKPVVTAAPVETMATKKPDPLKIIFINSISDNDSSALKMLLAEHSGESEVYFKITMNGEARIVKTAFRVNKTEELIKILKERFSHVLSVVEN